MKLGPRHLGFAVSLIIVKLGPHLSLSLSLSLSYSDLNAIEIFGVHFLIEVKSLPVVPFSLGVGL